MPLDFTQFSSQLDDLVAQAVAADRQEWLRRAREQLRQIDRTELEAKLDRHHERRMPWLTAEPVGDLHSRYPVTEAPENYSVLAVDGSNIPPDRHTSIRFYVLNTGWVRITYGERPDVAMNVDTRVRHRPDELYFDDDRMYPVEGTRLSALMAVTELESLRDAVEAHDRSEPVVGLLDGTMILWMIQADRQIQERLIERYTATLDWFAERRIPVASYISSPGSFELTNMLRVSICPNPGRDCRQCRTDENLKLCYEVREFRDPVLLATELSRGERTCIFRSQSQILEHYGRHEIQYFYMHTGDEIARVELPAWVAEDEELLNTLHAVIWDQCCRSGEQPPYPPALHEAHEQAVISTGDRAVVEQLLAERLAGDDVLLTFSAKARHKRTRGL